MTIRGERDQRTQENDAGAGSYPDYKRIQKRLDGRQSGVLIVAMGHKSEVF